MSNPDKYAILQWLRLCSIRLEPFGSRVTCKPAPRDTDEDWLALVRHRDVPTLEGVLASSGAQRGGSMSHSCNGFYSWRLGDLNVVLTSDSGKFSRMMTATNLTRQFNLLRKEDRVALGNAIVHGAIIDNGIAGATFDRACRGTS